MVKITELCAEVHGAGRTCSLTGKEWFAFRAQPLPVPSCWHGRSPWMGAQATHLERQPNGRSFLANSSHQELIRARRQGDPFGKEFVQAEGVESSLTSL